MLSFNFFLLLLQMRFQCGYFQCDIFDSTRTRTVESFVDNIPQNSILVTFDVKSLYTNIPLKNYPLSSLLTGILYILVKNYNAIGTLSKMIKVYEAYLQPHRSWRLKEIVTLKTFRSIPTLITDHDLYFDSCRPIFCTKK